jgi:hypothetical protein
MIKNEIIWSIFEYYWVDDNKIEKNKAVLINQNDNDFKCEFIVWINYNLFLKRYFWICVF